MVVLEEIDLTAVRSSLVALFTMFSAQHMPPTSPGSTATLKGAPCPGLTVRRREHAGGGSARSPNGAPRRSLQRNQAARLRSKELEQLGPGNLLAEHDPSRRIRAM